MKIAVIDIGSNSIRLLISEVFGNNILPIEKDLITTRLGRGVAENNLLDNTAISDTISALILFKNKALAMGCEKIFAIATSAVREADNGEEFVSEVKKKTDIDIEILTGHEEAEASFIGTKSGIKVKGMTLIVDVGGGSTELSLGETNIIYTESLPIGAVRMTQKFIKSDPPAKEEIIKAKFMIENLLTDFITSYNHIASGNKVTALGIGGTITTLASMAQELEVYDPKQIHGYHLKVEDVERMLAQLTKTNLQQRYSIKGLSPKRADIIICGALITLVIMRKLNFDFLIVSEQDIMEGIILKKLFKKS